MSKSPTPPAEQQLTVDQLTFRPYALHQDAPEDYPGGPGGRATQQFGLEGALFTAPGWWATGAGDTDYAVYQHKHHDSPLSPWLVRDVHGRRQLIGGAAQSRDQAVTAALEEIYRRRAEHARRRIELRIREGLDPFPPVRVAHDGHGCVLHVRCDCPDEDLRVGAEFEHVSNVAGQWLRELDREPWRLCGTGLYRVRAPRRGHGLLLQETGYDAQRRPSVRAVDDKTGAEARILLAEVDAFLPEEGSADGPPAPAGSRTAAPSPDRPALLPSPGIPWNEAEAESPGCDLPAPPDAARQSSIASPFFPRVPVQALEPGMRLVLGRGSVHTVNAVTHHHGPPGHPYITMLLHGACTKPFTLRAPYGGLDFRVFLRFTVTRRDGRPQVWDKATGRPCTVRPVSDVHAWMLAARLEVACAARREVRFPVGRDEAPEGAAGVWCAVHRVPAHRDTTDLTRESAAAYDPAPRYERAG